MLNPKAKTIAIIPSAGFSVRMGKKKKNYLSLCGLPILAHTLRAFDECALIDEVIVVVQAGDIAYCRAEVVERCGIKKAVSIVAGGLTRQASVGCGLKHAEDSSIIVVHDGARPFVAQRLIEETVRAAKKHGAAVAGVRPKDTVKEVFKDDPSVRCTLDRESLRLIQTPQAFRTEILMDAHREAEAKGLTSTDESSLVEAMGLKVFVVEGSYENIKITTEEDLVMGESILKRRASSASHG